MEMRQTRKGMIKNAREFLETQQHFLQHHKTQKTNNEN